MEWEVEKIIKSEIITYTRKVRRVNTQFTELRYFVKWAECVTHIAPERMRQSSYPTLAHGLPGKSDATPPSSPDIGTKGHQQSPG